MATGNGYDLRRNDLRSNVLENPYWITSAEIVAATVDTYDAVLFSFPVTQIVSPGYGTNLICIHAFLIEICVGITGGTAVMTIGLGSLAADVCGKPGAADVTDITVDNFLQDTDLVEATPAYYGPQLAGGAYGVAIGACADFDTGNTAVAITPNDTTTIAVVMYQTGTPTAGSSRVHMLISEVPSGR